MTDPITVTGDGESRRTTMRVWCPETRRVGTLAIWTATGPPRMGFASFHADGEAEPDPVHCWTRSRVVEPGGFAFDGRGAERVWHRRGGRESEGRDG